MGVGDVDVVSDGGRGARVSGSVVGAGEGGGDLKGVAGEGVVEEMTALGDFDDPDDFKALAFQRRMRFGQPATQKRVLAGDSSLCTSPETRLLVTILLIRSYV